MEPVVHVITTIELGGAEKQLLTLVRMQCSIGRTVSVIPLKGALELLVELESAGATVITTLLGKGPLNQLFLLLKILNSRPSIVHAHLPRAELFASLTKGKNSLIVSRHNSEPFFPGVPKFVSRLLAKFVTFRSEILIAISQAVYSFVRLSGEVASQTPMEVVYYGYEGFASELDSEKPTLLDIWHGSNQGPIFGTIGRLVPQKDYPTLINAFKKVTLEIPTAKLIILGEGAQRNLVEKIISDNQLEKSVALLGKKPNIHQYLNLMDLFVLASRYEGFGLVLLEAMSSGIPIVAANNSAIPEVLGSDHPGLAQTGNISDFAEKMKALLTEGGRKRALEVQLNSLFKFSPENMLAKMDEVYSRVEN
jgi:glycosyltransferase involved in cell wall biosynthesis